MKLPSLIVLFLACAAWTAQAQNSPHWIVRAGVHPIQPKPRNHSQLHVSDGAAVTFAATYMATEHWGIEAFGALPVSHDIHLRDGGKVAEFDQLPASLSLQYSFFDPNGRVRAFVGAGLSRTAFLDEHTTGAWTGADLRLATSFGPAAQAGLEFAAGRGWFVSLDARWFDIDTRAPGAGIGRLEIDPYAVGMTIGRRVR